MTVIPGPNDYALIEEESKVNNQVRELVTALVRKTSQGKIPWKNAGWVRPGAYLFATEEWEICSTPSHVYICYNEELYASLESEPLTDELYQAIHRWMLDRANRTTKHDRISHLADIVEGIV